MVLLMKKLLGIAVLCLLLNGCATTSPDVTQNKIRIGMSKTEFCNEAMSMSAKKDACRLTYTEMMKNTPRGPYYPDTKMEIMHNLTSEKNYVFENVSALILSTYVAAGWLFMSRIGEQVRCARNWAPPSCVIL